MSVNELIPSLALFTLVAVLLAIGVALLSFLRKRRNRHPMDTPAGRAADDRRRQAVEERREQ